jgi:dihydrofolate reductase
VGKLVYAIIVSLDGFICDQDGNFDWGEPGEEVHRYINDLESKSEIMLLGRKMYGILAAWENIEGIEKHPDYIRAYEGMWKARKKIVFSRSLKEVWTANTILKNEFLPEDIRTLKRNAQGNLSIGGADIASQALDSDLVDEIMLFAFPVVVGRGRRWIANEKVKNTKLLGTKAFGDGVVLSHYSVL